MLDTLIQDLKYSARGLLARPGFLIASVLTLALGIGANTAIFSVLHGLFLAPLPYPDGERLVQVYNTYPKMGLDFAGSSIPDYLDRKHEADALEDLAIYTGMSLNMAGEGKPERLVGIMSSPSLFSTLQVAPALGRAYTDAEAEPGNELVAVLSHATWQKHFAGDADVLERSLRLNGKSYRVIGVMPEGFAFPNRNVQIWIPFAFTAEQKSDTERGNEYSSTIGRLKPGATIEQLDAQMDAIVARVADRVAGAGEDGASFAAFLRSGAFQGRARSQRDQDVGNLRSTLVLLQLAVLAVLLIACANVANLTLTRVASRHKELSVRAALGAGRWRMARQMIVEMLLLGLTGGVAGLLLAYWGLDLIRWLGLDNASDTYDFALSGPVLLFALGAALATALLSALAPLFALLRTPLADVMKETGRIGGGGRGAQAARSTLVVIQMALAVTLLAGAGLLIKSFHRLQNESPGFDSHGVVAFRVDQTPGRNADIASRVAFYDRIIGELRQLPGVSHAGITNSLPFGNSFGQSSFNIVGQDLPPGTPSPHGHIRIVDENYFAALKIPLAQGRLFDATDRDGAAGALVVDQLFAQRHFPQGALGGRITHGQDDAGKPLEWTIVGVVGNVKIHDLAEEVRKETYYFSYRQRADDDSYFVVRSTLDPATLIPTLREAVLRADPEQPIYDIKALDERIAVSLGPRRAPMFLLGLFAGVALVLAAVGIYGVLAFAVSQRTGELGVRMAIGAQQRDVLKLVLGQGGRLALLGIAIGLIAALAGGQVLSAQLFDVDARDPWTLALVVVALSGVALTACWLPARRAARTDPIVALRYE
jgi:predicted permease